MVDKPLGTCGHPDCDNPAEALVGGSTHQSKPLYVCGQHVPWAMQQVMLPAAVQDPLFVPPRPANDHEAQTLDLSAGEVQRVAHEITEIGCCQYHIDLCQHAADMLLAFSAMLDPTNKTVN